MSAFRKEKLAELYKRATTIYLQKNVHFPDTVLSITNIELAEKLNRLSIYFSVFPDNKEGDMIKSLERIKGELRSHLANEVRTKYAPEIEFILDESEKKRLRIEGLLNQDK